MYPAHCGAAQETPAAGQVLVTVEPAVEESPVASGPVFATPTTLDRAGRIVAPIEINGRGPFRFILDTGANRSALSEATAVLLGLAPESGSTVAVHGITGSAELPVVRVQQFRAGDLVIENQQLPVLPAAVFGNTDGILGIDALQDVRIEVDFEHDTVVIRRSSGRPAAKGYIVVKAKRRHGGLLLVKGKVGSIGVSAILDTGAERSLGNEVLRAALADRERRPQAGVATTVIGATEQLVEGTSIWAPDIVLGTAQVNDLVVTFGDLHVFNVWSLNQEPALVIGMDLLGTLQRFVVDYRRGEFHFKVWEGGSSATLCPSIGCRRPARER
ncbi:MAG: retroviral-like aspartic protease family protein [Steroidobacteraceae bacterium]|nr:retroviral-like aspartic protease family protein [Steroidobacteraceae bacterium]